MRSTLRPLVFCPRPFNWALSSFTVIFSSLVLKIPRRATPWRLMRSLRPEERGDPILSSAPVAVDLNGVSSVQAGLLPPPPLEATRHQAKIISKSSTNTEGVK